ncbi:similar to Saccharomyces cerevisiae YLR289W GUF1 Mitochondrial matrix GTPase that associates with mitochondrial ribosomes [Maudiozyma saulgeensis]|uniref:Similar to Saccharomyces cerevisiae YLR289W GUF1 Mitochondrial matrix GTPase that associates with mitochondrial ribosomes n=1 Tax=Maudiozyma saulgeensis TaxID=1789683 RepID=A0A1X7R6E8_9SACH|nr:similar to Saccharomyces cerevisiae YLR289W GUF1 Mitochondrial matrix GTPase that associates with mitochondrial ribosomes [Kazachstania saulgeensis]
MLRIWHVSRVTRITFQRFNQTLTNKINAVPIDKYRVFSIVAHIDHGKSTLSDRLLEITDVISDTDTNAQVLDKLEVERERGITIKAQTCTMFYKDYLLQLIDTPGHVDFKGEVSRAFSSVDGAILLVDAQKGVQAQTVANFQMANDYGVKMLPVINKVDLLNAEVQKVEDQIVSSLGFRREDIVKISAKSGLNIEEKLLPAIINSIPSPTGEIKKPFRSLILDSWYDSYLGVVMLVKVVDGEVKKGDKISSGRMKKKFEVKEIGIMYPNQTPTGNLKAGQVGYIVPGTKDFKDALLGDTLVHVAQEKKTELLPGFEEPKPMVFVGAFPADGIDLKIMDDDINRLVLNDRSVTLQRETSNALGQGWRLGFLGSLHASVFKERLEKEYGSKLIITHPTVPYLVQYDNGVQKIVRNPDEFPDSTSKNRTRLKSLQEPYVEAIMTLPNEYLGTVIQLCNNARGEQIELSYLDVRDSVLLKYHIPLSQLVDDFFGKLKSATKGFATLDYEDCGYKESDIVKLELLVNGRSLDALSQVVHKSQVEKIGREWVKKFKEYVNSQLYEVVIQARVNNKIVARETLKARRKDVLAKLHASDVSRRKKLLVKQKEGKKHLKSIGNIQISQDAYQAFLRK